MVVAGAPGAVIADVSLTGSLGALLLGGLAFIAILLFFTGLRRTVGGGSHGMAARLEAYGAREVAAAQELRRRQAAGFYGRIDRAVAAQGFAQRLTRDLARADVKITVGEYLVITVVLASLGALIGFALPIGGHILLGLVLMVVGLVTPRFYVQSHKNKRLRAFNGHLSDTIGLLSGALRSGYSLLQAMELVAREGPTVVAGEFERVVREVGLGLSPEEALANLVNRMQSDDLELMVTAINVQREVGGNLAEVLDTIAHTIRERVKLVGEVRALTAQQQYSGYILAVLPVALALILFVINPTYMLGLYTHTHYCGWVLTGCSVTMVTAGFLVIQRIVDIKV
jgi:tight adherence protein B